MYFGERAKMEGFLGVLISPEIFCPRAIWFSARPPSAGWQFVISDFYFWICGLNSAK